MYSIQILQYTTTLNIFDLKEEQPWMINQYLQNKKCYIGGSVCVHDTMSNSELCVFITNVVYCSILKCKTMINAFAH